MNGVDDVYDPRFKKEFEDFYSSTLNPWYMVLGNHDGYHNPMAQVQYGNFSDRWIMPGQHYIQDFSLTAGGAIGDPFGVYTHPTFPYNIGARKTENLDCSKVPSPAHSDPCELQE